MSFYYALSQSLGDKNIITTYCLLDEYCTKGNGNEKENDQFILPGKTFLNRPHRKDDI